MNHRIFKARDLSRTHSHSHPHCANISVGPLIVDDFHRAMARDIENRTAQCISEWLTPNFTFFVEVHGKRLLSQEVRLNLGRVICDAVSRFSVVPTSVMVLGWRGEIAESATGFRLRYVFEDVVVDRRRALTIWSLITHEVFRSANESFARRCWRNGTTRTAPG